MIIMYITLAVVFAFLTGYFFTKAFDGQIMVNDKDISWVGTVALAISTLGWLTAAILAALELTIKAGGVT